MLVNVGAPPYGVSCGRDEGSSSSKKQKKNPMKNEGQVFHGVVL